MRQKASKEQVEERKQYIRELFLQRVDSRDIVAICRTKYDMHEKSVMRLMTMVRKELKERAAKDQEIFYEKNIKTLEDTIKEHQKYIPVKGLGAGNVIVNAVRELNKMTGNAVEKHSHDVSGSVNITVSNEFLPKIERNESK